MNLKRGAAAFAFVIALLPPAAAHPQGRRGSAPKAPPKPAPQFIARSLSGPDDAEVAGRVYTNRFFGIGESLKSVSFDRDGE